jgi:hypothetical protein
MKMQRACMCLLLSLFNSRRHLTTSGLTSQHQSLLKFFRFKFSKHASKRVRMSVSEHFDSQPIFRPKFVQRPALGMQVLVAAVRKDGNNVAYRSFPRARERFALWSNSRGSFNDISLLISKKIASPPPRISHQQIIPP